MDRIKDLTEVAMVAGLRDFDMLKVAKVDLSPVEAVRDLLRRYPGAFHAEDSGQFEKAMQPKHYKQMTPEELDAFQRKYGLPGQLKQPKQPVGFDAMTPKEQDAFRRKHNIPVSIRGAGGGMRVF